MLGSLLRAPTMDAVETVGNVLDKLFTSDDEKLTHDLARQRLLLMADDLQAKINTQEAQHRSLFIAGWRPFIGWVCGLALFYVYLLYPLLIWLNRLYFPDISPPAIEIDHLLELVIALLGLSGLRTYEKLKNRTF